MKVVYKITYPNAKIYVGKDLTNNINYFGNANPGLIARDFGDQARAVFTVTREILWSGSDASNEEVNRMELYWIRTLRSNDPAVGYNRWPPVKPL